MSTPKSRCVIRLSTSTWQDARGLHVKKNITFLRRKCVEYNILEEDASAIGVEEVIARVHDIHSKPDGVYDVVLCDKLRDWESGSLEDYSYMLVPYTP